MLYVSPTSRRWTTFSRSAAAPPRAAAPGATLPGGPAASPAWSPAAASPAPAGGVDAARALWHGSGWAREEELAYHKALRNLDAATQRERVLMVAETRVDDRAMIPGAGDTRGLAQQTLVALWNAQPRDARLVGELSSAWGELTELGSPDRASASLDQY